MVRPVGSANDQHAGIECVVHATNCSLVLNMLCVCAFLRSTG